MTVFRPGWSFYRLYNKSKPHFNTCLTGNGITNMLLPVYLYNPCQKKITALKILIIRFSSIGDIVLTTPVIRSLKQQLPGAQIHFLTKKAFGQLLLDNPYVDRLHLLGDSPDNLLKSLKTERFDYVVDLHNNLRSLRFKFALGARNFSFNKLNAEKWLKVRFKIDLLPAKHIVDRYLDTVKSLGIVNDGQGLDFFIPENSRVNPDRLAPVYRSGYIGFVIGGQHATKMLPREKIAAVCEALNYPVVLIGGPDDKANGQWIEAKGNGRVLNACGSFSLAESADLVRQARVIITHDTGLMHIAAALHKKIVVVWGNTIPEFGMYPYFPDGSSDFINFEQKLSCRPCSKIGYANCPRGHFKCMQLQNTTAIALSAHAYLAEDIQE